MKRVYPLDIKTAIIIQSIFILILGIVGALDQGESFDWLYLIYIGVLIIGFYHMSYAYVELKEESVVFKKGIRKWEMKYSEIESIELGYRKLDSRTSIPAMYILQSGKSKPAYIYHRRYGNQRLIEIINHIKRNNRSLRLCGYTYSLVSNIESDLEKKYKRDEKMRLRLVIFSFIVCPIILIIIFS